MNRKIELFTKEKIKILKNTGFFHIACSSVFSKSITFIGTILLVKILSKNDYGIYTYANELLNFFLIANGFGTASAVLQFCSEASEPMKKLDYFNYGIKFGTKFNFVLCFLIVISSIVLKFSISGSNEYLKYMFLLPIVNYLFEVKSIYLRSEMKNQEYSKSTIVYSLFLTLSSILLSYYFSIRGLIIARYLSAIVSLMIITRNFGITIPKNKPSLEKEEKRSFVNISFISMLSNGLSTLLYSLDIFVIGLLMQDSEMVASYKTATTIPTALNLISSIIVIYIYPYFAKNNKNKNWLITNYKKTLIYTMIISFGISFVMILMAPVIIRIAFGLEYIDILQPFRILCVSFAISAPFRILSGNLLVTQKKVKFNLIIDMITGLLNIILNFFFINKFGIVGAAISTLSIMSITGIINTTYLFKTFNSLE